MQGDNELEPSGYEAILGEVSALLDNARRAAAPSVNAIMTMTYWEVGRIIVEHEQVGEERAAYGASLSKRLAADLTLRFGRGFGGGESPADAEVLSRMVASFDSSDAV